MTEIVLASMLIEALGILQPVPYDSGRLWMFLPLALIVAVVYKALKVEDVRQVPIAALLLWVTIMAGMVAVWAGLYVITLIFL